MDNYYHVFKIDGGPTNKENCVDTFVKVFLGKEVREVCETILQGTTSAEYSNGNDYFRVTHMYKTTDDVGFLDQRALEDVETHHHRKFFIEGEMII